MQKRSGCKIERDPYALASSFTEMHSLFCAEQRMIVAATADASGDPWVSLLCGSPGFLDIIDERTLVVRRPDFFDELLVSNIKKDNHIGLLGIDFTNRRRLRINGCAFHHNTDDLIISAHQIYINCPLYIQKREFVSDALPSAQPSLHIHKHLTDEQMEWIREADTFFLGTCHPEYGADASHRGGNPGFVKAITRNTVVFPDYTGNFMFNSLGNMLLHPRAGLLFVNYEEGHTLQMTGGAEIIWEQEAVAQYPGANRIIRLSVEMVIERKNCIPMKWKLVERSPANP